MCLVTMKWTQNGHTRVLFFLCAFCNYLEVSLLLNSVVVFGLRFRLSIGLDYRRDRLRATTSQ